MLLGKSTILEKGAGHGLAAYAVGGIFVGDFDPGHVLCADVELDGTVVFGVDAGEKGVVQRKLRA